MVNFSAFVVFSSTLSAFASQFGKRTVPQVEADIATITTDVNTLTTGVNGFPTLGGTLLGALTLHLTAVKLRKDLDQGTTDVKSTGVFNEADGQNILQSIQTLQPTIISGLNGIVAKKAEFDALQVSSVVQCDLGRLNTSTSAFGNALIAAAPADLTANGTTIKDAIDAAFANAISAYANA